MRVEIATVAYGSFAMTEVPFLCHCERFTESRGNLKSHEGIFSTAAQGDVAIAAAYDMIRTELCEKAMELTPEQDRKIETIMAEMDCPAGFPCYESGFEALTTVRVLSYGPVECLRAKDELCPMSVNFGLQDRRCECPLRRYIASEFGR